MTEVFFYHLQRYPLERVLPMLLEKCLEREWNVLVQFRSDERMEALNEALWTFSDEKFLPHGTRKEPDPELQPILLSLENDSLNDPQVRIFVEGAEPEGLEGLERAMVLFDGNDDAALALARAQYKALRDKGVTLSYWQQDDDGRWHKKA